MLLACCGSAADNVGQKTPNLLQSLEPVKVHTLRKRAFQSNIKVEAFSRNSCVGDNAVQSLPDATGLYKSYMASFRSDGLLQYARITLPTTPPPPDGYPYVLFLHGWIGKYKAPGYSIGCNPENLYYSELTDAFARAGYAVLSPGYRGHASVNGVAAEGIEYLEAFDQGAGISTQFYAIDALNFSAGVSTIDGSKFPDKSFKFDPARFYLLGHSQGGDAGLSYLAAIGEGHQDKLRPVHAALWSGTFLDRLSALEDMMPVDMTPEAFLSGDGSWTGTAIGRGGEVNANFIYAYPPDYIGNPNPENWTWQKEQWSEPSVREAVVKSTQKMYDDLSANVDDLSGIGFSVEDRDDGSFSIDHDPKIKRDFSNIGGFYQAEYLTENIDLHVPEKDYYSRIIWNKDLCQRISQSGGRCDVIIYPHNNHSLRASQHEWFSPAGSRDGYPIMIENLIAKYTEIETAREGKP